MSQAVPETVTAPVEGDALATEPPLPSIENDDGVSDSHSENDDESRDEGDSDPDSSSDEEANEPVLNPSKDIKGDLENVLGAGCEYNGTFGHSETYDDAPNPMLQVPGFGVLGLPLNPHEAKRLIGVCSQAPFGKNERTVIDKSVRDTWEPDGSKLRFTNPLWDKWLLEKAVPAVSSALGVTSGTPTVHLYKLLVYETGSHFLAHQDTEKIPGMFASIIITLPSAFEGASLHLSHSGETKVFDLAARSGTTTSVLAWYSDVYHAVHPVTSGYRLALSYNLVMPQSTGKARPITPKTSTANQQLRHVLRSWVQNHSGNSPAKIIYNLDHKYSMAGLGSGSLKGADADLLAFLRPVAEDLNFELYIVNIELRQTGDAEDDGYDYYSRNRRRGWYSNSDDDDDEAENMTMGDVTDSTFSITNAVTLDGKQVKLYEDIDEEDMIPYRLSEQEHDDQEYEGYQGNYAGSLEYWYRATAILIIPPDESERPEPYEYSLARLEEKLLRGWTRRDALSRHVERALQGAAHDGEMSSRVMELLHQCAIASNHLSLWIHAVQKCGAKRQIDRLGIPNLVQAIDAFGFASTRPILEGTLSNATQNKIRFELAQAFLEKSKLLEDDAFRDWATTRANEVWQTLKPPSADDIPMLSEIAHTQGLQAFMDITIPQLVKLEAKSDILVPLTEQLHRERPNFSSAEQDTLRAAINRLVALVISRFMPLTSNNLTESVKIVSAAIILCGNVEAMTQLEPLFTSIRTKFQALQSKGDACVRFLLPLLAQVETARAKSEQLKGADVDEVFTPLYALVAVVFQHGMFEKSFASHTTELVLCLPRLGDIHVVKAKLAPHVAEIAKRNAEVLQSFSTTLYRARHTFNLVTPEDHKAFRDIIHHLFAAISANTTFNMTVNSAPTAYAYAYGAMKPWKPALDLINLCFSFEAESLPLCERVTKRLQPPSAAKVGDWFRFWVKPFVEELQVLLKTHKVDLRTEPFRSFVASSVMLFVNSVGRKPQEPVPRSTLAKFGCGCHYCMPVRKFLLGSTGHVIIAEKQAGRTHIENNLASSGARNWGVQWETLRRGSPYQLKITKPAAMVALGSWKTDSEYALRFILTLGDAKTQRGIFGDNFSKIMIALDAPAAMTANLPGSSAAPRQAVPTSHATSSSTASSSLNKVAHPGSHAGASGPRASLPSSVGRTGPTGGIATSSAYTGTIQSVVSKPRASLASSSVARPAVLTASSIPPSATAGPSTGEKRVAPSDVPPPPKKKAKLRPDVPVIELSD